MGVPRSCIQGDMSSTRALLLALFATIAIATCQLPGEAVVEESVEPFEEEFMQAPIDETLTHKMNGAKVIADSEAVATAGPSDAHDEITCASGEVMCADGTCAIECPSVDPDAKPGFKYEFQPNPTQLAAPPNVAGRQADYEAMASNFHDSQISGEQQAIVNAEQSAGLGFASHDSVLQEHEQRLAAKKQEVEKDMNLAAAEAAHFKEASKSHDEAALNVKKSQEEEKAQERVVEEAKKTLEAEEKKLREAKLYVSKMIQIEEDARYKAEHSRQVALKAVKEAAARDLARTKEEALIHHAKKAAIGVPTGSAAGSAKSPKKCSDCTSLPHIYVEAGGKCADCSKWAAKGECKQAEYKKFMTHYCAESCGCPESTEVPETTEMQMPQQDEDEEY